MAIALAVCQQKRARVTNKGGSGGSTVHARVVNCQLTRLIATVSCSTHGQIDILTCTPYSLRLVLIRRPRLVFTGLVQPDGGVWCVGKGRWEWFKCGWWLGHVPPTRWPNPQRHQRPGSATTLQQCRPATPLPQSQQRSHWVLTSRCWAGL